MSSCLDCISLINYNNNRVKSFKFIIINVKCDKCDNIFPFLFCSGGCNNHFCDCGCIDGKCHCGYY